MANSRLATIFAGHVPSGHLLIIGAGAQTDLSPFDPARTTIEQRYFHDVRALEQSGWQVSPLVEGRFDAGLALLPRAKAEARDRIARAAAMLAPGADLWIDGQKTDGVDSILREIRQYVPVDEVHSKGHGKTFRITVPDQPWLPDTWLGKSNIVTPGFVTRPGVFSADGVDPASAMLARALPARLPTRIVDLGAGWGWLSAQALAREGVEILHLVEADHAALQSARDNITDPRARFHWADARDFHLAEPVNGVIMNPPFHSGRHADPALGAAFIQTAARLLTGAGHLWMVANRHLPYEASLQQHFAKVQEIAGDARFKVIEATGAGRGSARRVSR